MLFTRKSSVYRPLADENNKYLSQITFYNSKTSTIIGESKQGWLDVKEDGFSKDITFLPMPGCIIKRKVDLSSTKPFMIKSADKTVSSHTYNLYIPETLYTIIDKEIVIMPTPTNDLVFEHLTIAIDGATSDNVLKTHNTVIKNFIETRSTVKGNIILELKKEFEELSIKLSSYDIETLLEKYNITKK